MCNAYTVRPKVGKRALDEVISAEMSRLPSPLVRRTGKGVVALLDGDTLVPATMRWGIRTPRFDSINNARADKLTSRTWADALENRRCLVPISTFYEWQELPHRAKQPYEFKRPDGDWMWVAGLHAPSEEYGSCYATITTGPPERFAAIHDRMLAVLDFETGMAFLRGGIPAFEPDAGVVTATPCASPLKRKPPEDPQGELF